MYCFFSLLLVSGNGTPSEAVIIASSLGGAFLSQATSCVSAHLHEEPGTWGVTAVKEPSFTLIMWLSAPAWCVNAVKEPSLTQSEDCSRSCTLHDGWMMSSDQGSISWKIFALQFKFHGNFILLASKLWSRDRYKILHMARQLCSEPIMKYYQLNPREYISLKIISTYWNF